MALDFHGTTGCVDRARKFDQRTIPRGLYDTAAIFRDLGIDQFAAASLERRESSFLVIAHQAAIAGDIGREDGSEPSFDACLGHEDRPGPP
jgi:hypothetical protein